MKVKLSRCIFVSDDTSAVSVGADAVATAVQTELQNRGMAMALVRNGSRGLCWLEPLVEVEIEGERHAFGPVSPMEVPALFETAFSQEHKKYLGLTDQIPYLARQSRVTFARVGVTDPLSPQDYENHGGLVGLRHALTMSSSEIVQEVTDSGLRGRGGAAFPAGIKWRTVLDAPGDQKYITCNADEGDSGTFSDRMLMEGDPFCLIEGMIIAGLAVGATLGYIYLRSEYPLAHKKLNAAIEIASREGWLGDSVMESANRFQLEVRLGAGAYICGEETAMLESLEGKRGMVRPKPPLPALEGLFGCPTVVNNVITLASIPAILADGAAAYESFGIDRSRGTLPLQLAGNVKQGGLVEIGFGRTLREVVDEFGCGTLSGRPMKAIQVGGPLGAYLPESQWDTPIDYEAFVAINAMLGHGGIVVFDDTVDMGEQARFAFEFCALESCGKCTPCRIGSVRGVEVVDKIRDGVDRESNLIVLKDLCNTLLEGSLCAMGGMTPFPVMSVMKHFAEDLEC